MQSIKDLFETQRKGLSSHKKEYRKLQKLCEKPGNQHYWDGMLRLEGYINGIELGLAVAEKINRKHLRHVRWLKQSLNSLLTEIFECGAWWESANWQNRKELRISRAKELLATNFNLVTITKLPKRSK